MSNLSVCCVMLVNGRPEMVKRAIASFRAQTYPNKSLLIFDTGMWPFGGDTEGVRHVIFGSGSGIDTIGQLRNEANSICSADILAHFDSDDWSHPHRLMEQLTLLEYSKSDCVGYTDLLFWDSTPGKFCGAWQWSEADNRKPIGTSLCYWRKAWEHVPFQAMPNRSGATSEYYHWLKAVKAFGVTSLPEFHGEVEQRPRMIASIHGANTQYYDPASYVANRQGTSWMRAAAWDKMCSEIMAL